MIAESMLGHLEGQFNNSRNLNAVVEALGDELEELNMTFTDLRTKRWIDTGEGVQLDGIGQIVDRSRQIDKAVQIPFFGFFDTPNGLGFEQGRFRDTFEQWLQSYNLNDAEYRLVLWEKVFQNHSVGTTEDTIQSLQFIFETNHINISEKGNAKISIGVGRRLLDSEKILADAVQLFIRAGGVGVVLQEEYDYDSYFGFLGQQNAKGFDVGTFADIF